MARATSVTLNRLSTSQSTAALLTMAAVHPSRHRVGLIRSNSARNVNAHRRPHHAAGRTLRARQIRRGMYQRLSTPRITAMRGWSGLSTSWADGVSEEAWDGGMTADEDWDAEGDGGRELGPNVTPDDAAVVSVCCRGVVVVVVV